MLIQAVPFTTPLMSRAAVAAPQESTESAPTETVTLSSTPAASPWPDLRQAGLMYTFASLGGPLGGALTEASRQGLLDSVERCQEAGVKFLYRRRFRLPWIRGKYKELTASEMVTRLEGQKGDIKRLEVQEPKRDKPWELYQLAELEALDIVHGGAVPCELRTGQVLDTLKHFELQGMKFTNGQYYYDSDPNLTLSQALARAGREDPQLYLNGNERRFDIRNQEAINAMEYFHGTGQDIGLARPDQAKLLQEVAGRDVALKKDGYETTPFALYLADSKAVSIHREDGPAMRFPLDGSYTPDRMEEELDDYTGRYQKFLAPALTRANLSLSYVPAEVLKLGGPYPQEFRMGLYSEVLNAVIDSGAGRDTTSQAEQLFTSLLEAGGSTFSIAQRAHLVLPAVRLHGPQAAQRVLAQADETLSEISAPGPEKERLTQLFFKLHETVPSVEACLEGLDLVRIPVEGSTEEQRLAVFEAIGARQSSETLPDTARHYRAVLVHRGPDESLSQAGGRFVKLLTGLSIGRNQQRAPGIFAAIQKGVRDSTCTSEQADSMVDSFLSNLMVSNSLEKALATAQFSENLDGTIAEDEDTLVVGGFEVPRESY